MFCSKCGTQLPEGAGSCHGCGAKSVAGSSAGAAAPSGQSPPGAASRPAQAAAGEHFAWSGIRFTQDGVDSAVGVTVIVGAVPAQTGYEDVAVAIRQHSEGLEAAGVQISLIFVLHDGHPNDAAAAKKLCLELRGKVEVIGILLDPDDSTRNAMRAIFGEDRLVACAAGKLPMKLAAMLRSVRGV